MTKFIALPFLLLLFGYQTMAHEFHVGLCFAEYEEESRMMFCTIQLESGDFEHWLEDQNQKYNLNELAVKQKNSAFWKDFESFISKYFHAKTNEAKIDFELFEIEIEPDGRLFVHLVAYNVPPFSSIIWHFSLLMGHSMEQQNKLEFNYLNAANQQLYFLYFFENEFQKTIEIKS